MVSEVFTLRVLLGVAASLLLTSYALGVETDHATQILLMLYGIPFLLLGAVQSAYLLTSNECFHWASMQQIVAQGSYALGVFACIRTAADLPLLAAVSLASIALSAALGWLKLADLGFSLRWVWTPRAFVELLKQSAPFGIASLGSQLYTRSGHIVVRWALGETALGIYSAVIRLVEVLYGFVGIFFGLVIPRLALLAELEQQRRALSSKVFLATWTVAVPLAVGGSMLGPEIVATTLGRQYEAGGDLFQIVSFYFLTNSLAIFFAGTILYALGLRYRYLVATVAGAVVGVIVNVLLIPMLGLSAACSSYVFSQLVVAIVAWRLAPMELGNIWRSKLTAAPVGGSLIMAAALAVTAGHGLDVWLQVVLGAAIYASAILAIAHRALSEILRK